MSGWAEEGGSVREGLLEEEGQSGRLRRVRTGGRHDEASQETGTAWRKPWRGAPGLCWGMVCRMLCSAGLQGCGRLDDL